MKVDRDFLATFENLKPGEILWAYEDAGPTIRREGRRKDFPLLPTEYFSGAESAAIVLRDVISPFLALFAGIELELVEIQDEEGNALPLSEEQWEATASGWMELDENTQNLVGQIEKFKFIVKTVSN